MANYPEKIKIAEATARKALDAFGDYRAELKARRKAEFAAAGGCERCNGRGWVVTWDTLDSLSGCYAEYGPCPEAEANPEAHGKGAPLNHATFDKYDKNRGVKIDVAATEAEAAELTRRERAYDAATRDAENACEAARPARGKTVKVVRGRKVPKGVTGRVFWEGLDRWGRGTRIGLETDEGERHFIAARHVEVVDAA